MATQIQVKLDVSANPPVTTIPPHASVNRGNSEIEWTPFANQSFVFLSLTGLPNPPFTAPIVAASQITLTDANTATQDYTYVITVTYNGSNYSSQSSHPQLTLQSQPTSPTIKNK